MASRGRPRGSLHAGRPHSRSTRWSPVGLVVGVGLTLSVASHFARGPTYALGSFAARPLTGSRACSRRPQGPVSPRWVALQQAKGGEVQTAEAPEVAEEAEDRDVSPEAAEKADDFAAASEVAEEANGSAVEPAPAVWSQKCGDILRMRSADEVLDLVERYIRNFTIFQTMAALRVISNNLHTLSPEAARSRPMAALVQKHNNWLGQQKIEAVPDISRVLTSTCKSSRKLRRLVPKTEMLETTASYAAMKALSKLRPPDIIYFMSFPAFQCERVMRNFVWIVRRKMRLFSAPALSNLTVNYAKAGLRSEKFLADLGDGFLDKFRTAKPNNMARMVQSFAIVGQRHDELFSAIADYATRNIGRFRVNELSLLAWSYTKLGIEDEALMRAIALGATWDLDELPPRTLSTLVWTFGVNKAREETFLPRATKAIVDKISSYEPGSLSRVVWGFASLNETDSELFEACIGRGLAVIGNFLPMSLSGMLWGFATVQYKDLIFMDAAAQSTLVKLDAYAAQDVSNTIWSFAKLEVDNLELFEAIAKFTVERIDEFSMQNLAMVVWSCASRKFNDRPLMEAVAAQMKKHPERLRSQSISIMAWACAVLNFRDEELMKVLSAQALPMLEDFNGQELGHLAWGFGRLSIMDAPLVERIIEVAIEKAEQLEEWNWENIIIAADRLGVPAGGALRHSADAILSLDDLSAVRVKPILRLMESIPAEDHPAGLYEALTAELERRKQARR